MFKRLLGGFVLSAVCCSGIENVELLADSVTKEGEKIIIANGNVLLYSQTYFVTADRAKFDQVNNIVELFGNVNLIKGLNETSRASYAKLDLNNDSDTFRANFLMDKESEVWMQNNESCSNQEEYTTKGSVVSSCNIDNPDWKIEFTSGTLNKKSKFLHLFNPVFYVGKVPVFYLPYFGFPLDKTRRTGLLFPELGYGKDEGFFYKQPIFIAPYAQWDLSIEPQIRSKRGKGIYGEFRFVDSMHSKGSIGGGVFEEKKEYADKNDLKHNKEYGYDIEYERDKLAKYLIDGDYEEGLWFKYTHLNDVNYLNLKERGGEQESAVVTSKFNYFVKTDEHYGGIYARHFHDTAKQSNDDTVQEIPIVQYHKATNSAFYDKFLYSFDTQFHNYTRKDGASAKQYEMNLPLSLSVPFANDYFVFTFSEHLYASSVNFDNRYEYYNGAITEDKSDIYVNQYHQFSVTSDLAKAYDDFYHTMYFSLDYRIPGYQNGNVKDRLFKKYQYDKDLKEGRLNRYALNNPMSNRYFENTFLSSLDEMYTTQNINAKFTNYVYNKDGIKRIRHSIEQGYNIEYNEASNLKNKISFYLPNNLNLYNNIEYNHVNRNLQKAQTGVAYSNEHFRASVDHTYENFINYRNNKKTYDKESYIRASVGINLPWYYTVFGDVGYDFRNSYAKAWQIGINKKRKCWSYTLAYRVETDPQQTNSGLKANKKEGIYLLFAFYPVGSVGYDMDISSNKDKEEE